MYVILLQPLRERQSIRTRLKLLIRERICGHDAFKEAIPKGVSLKEGTSENLALIGAEQSF
jgi:hypothetical protein